VKFFWGEILTFKMGCCCSQFFQGFKDKKDKKKRDSSSSSSGSSQERAKKPQSIKEFIDDCVKVHNKYRKKHGASSLSHAKVRLREIPRVPSD
jgi:hypothetical protein